jgi:hypothetical protein
VSLKEAGTQENNMKKLYLKAAVAALLTGLISVPALALDVGVGGNNNGGTTAKASQSSTSGSVTIGGGNNVGSATVGAGGNEAQINIGRSSGPLVDVDQNGNPVGGTSNTGAAVNLGALGGLINGLPGGSGGGGSIDPSDVRTAFNGMSVGQQAQLQTTCGAVLSSPQRYDMGMVQLCQLLITL